jgi:hypothetical protein
VTFTTRAAEVAEVRKGEGAGGVGQNVLTDNLIFSLTDVAKANYFSFL